MIVNVTLWTSLLLNASPPMRHTIFKSNALRLVSNEGQIKSSFAAI